MEKDAVYVLMHTFAHLLIKQMSMSSRVFFISNQREYIMAIEMAGILLYTGSADKEGSLGGLVELGTVERLVDLMKDSFQRRSSVQMTLSV